MDRSNPPIVFYNPAGVRKKPTNQTHRVAIRWIQEFPNQGPAASRADTISRVIDQESAEVRESRIYRRTATGERQLRAPLLNAFLLADAPLRLNIGSQRDPFSTLPVPWKPPYGIITSYCKITNHASKNWLLTMLSQICYSSSHCSRELRARRQDATGSS